MKRGKAAQRISSYCWLTSGIMLLGMFEAFYRDSMHEIPEMDLSLGGCLILDPGELENYSITSTANMDYTNSTYLPSTATLSATVSNEILHQIGISASFDGECIAKVTHPIANALKYSFFVALALSATVLTAELINKRDNIAKLFSSYIWLTAGLMSIGIFDAFYRNTLHQLPELDLSIGGCIVAETGHYPKNLEPNVIDLSYDSDHYPPQSVSLSLNPVKELAHYQPILFFKKECIAQITKPFGQALEISFLLAMGLSAGIILIEQWIKNDLSFSCRKSAIEHEQLSTDALSDEIRQSHCDLETGAIYAEETKNTLIPL